MCAGQETTWERPSKGLGSSLKNLFALPVAPPPEEQEGGGAAGGQDRRSSMVSVAAHVHTHKVKMNAEL